MSNKTPGPGISVSDLKKYGITDEIIRILIERGITELNPIQCLTLASGLFNGKNQVIVAPTSSGKTLIAEMAIVAHALNAKSSFYLVSLKALAEEKFDLFKRFWSSGTEPLLKTAITTGDRDFEDENLSNCQVTFATYEKLYALVRDKPSLLDRVSLIVVDELQTLGDNSRGAALESLLTFIRLKKPTIQLIGLSAALPNAKEISDWLNATACVTRERDIPLIEEVWTTEKIHSKTYGSGLDGIVERENHTHTNDTLEIVSDLIAKKRTPIVVFCMTKPRVEELAKLHVSSLEAKKSKIVKVFEEIKQLLLFVSEGGPTGKSLMDVIESGVAFHHADLSLEERQVIEGKIREGLIQVTYSTTTLGQGINLPVATVVFDSTFRHFLDSYLERREYVNMAGRAGRRGLQDAGGTAILICRNAQDRRRMNEYLSEEVELVESALENKPVDWVILNTVASHVGTNVKEVRAFLEQSLWGFHTREHNPKLLTARLEAVPKILRKLCEDGFLIASGEGEFRTTEFGRITSQKGLTPDTARKLRARLNKFCGVVENLKDFHAEIEQFTPGIIFLLADTNDESQLLYRDATTISFLNQHRSRICTLRVYEDAKEPDSLLQTAWVLDGWANGVSYAHLCAPFRKLKEGNIRGVADGCCWIMDSAAAISRIPEFKVPSKVSFYLQMLAKRLQYGVSEPGIPAMEVIRNRRAIGAELAGIGRSRVQELVTHGHDDLTKLVEATDNELLKVLREPRQVENLKNAVAKYLDYISNSSLASHQLRGQKVSREDLVKAVYEKAGKEFEVAVFRLLQEAGLSLQLLDEKKIPGCADILITTEKGNIQVECKTVIKGVIRNTESFEVIGKTRVGPDPIKYVTLGKPAFVDMAIKNAFENGVVLLTHKQIVDGALRVFEKKIAATELLNLFLTGTIKSVQE
jgi:helicase